jgi:WD40 repeat protein
VPSSSSLEALYEQYNVSDYYRSYLLEVYGEGYKAYYSSEVKTGVPLEVKLEPQHECFKYEKIAEEQTEFSIWWIKASKDFEYFATSAGAHSGPEMHPPSEVAVYFFNKDGKFLWRFPIPVLNYDNTDLCWGLDVSPDGSYVAVGCYDGSVYLIDREGKLVKKHQFPGMVRWVKFSPDGKYLAFGPTDNGVDYFGLFEVPSLKLVWEGFVGDWARTVDFSDDGSMIAVGSSNGVLSFFSIKGEKLWQLKPDMQDEAGFSAEQECVNTVLLSEDASIMVLGYDSGKIEIWKGQKAEVEKPKPKADIDGDGSVNSKDLEILKDCYGLTSEDKAFNPDADLNSDGKIDIVDLAILSFQFGV